jgi:glycosyltransferase involved in cell wall biosynthesis
MVTRRPRVALLPDVAGWAFDTIATQVRRHLSARYDVTILYRADYATRRHELFREVCSGGYDLVHVFAPVGVAAFLTPETVAKIQQTFGWSLLTIADRLAATRLTTSVHSHIRLDPFSVAQYAPIFTSCLAGYCVSSPKLRTIYEGLAGYPPPVRVVPDGVDLDLFRPRNLDRLSDVDRELTVGWAGDSRWGYARDGRDHKGLASIIRPAVAALQREGLAVRGVFQDRNERWVPHPDMVGYFNSLDIYVCASDTEGTPLPVLEAMACGLPVVSTDVGTVAEALGPRQAELIVRERSRDAVAAALRRLVTEPQTRRALSAENLERIKAWDWSERVHGWEDFFATCLARRPEADSAAARRRVLESVLPIPQVPSGAAPGLLASLRRHVSRAMHRRSMSVPRSE